LTKDEDPDEREGRRMPELDEETFQNVQAFCARGNALVDESRFSEAIDAFWSAWDLLPEPQTDWESATWILGAIGDVNFQHGNYTAGRDNLAMAMHCPGAIGNPFLHLRFGQCQFELGILDRAADDLTRAYLLAGEKLFEAEEPKYLAFLKSRLEPRSGG
jgi:tetratricopeptide (TPR) repeat protein